MASLLTPMRPKNQETMQPVAVRSVAAAVAAEDGEICSDQRGIRGSCSDPTTRERHSVGRRK